MNQVNILRAFDLALSTIGLTVLLPLMLILALACKIDVGFSLFKQKRVGRNKKPFTIYKFPTMKVGTPSIATHLVGSGSMTSFGRLIRYTKLDELPQLWNVIKGEMSLVGPRPCLLNQIDLIRAREEHAVFNVRPGITGIAQLRGIDMSSPGILAVVDKEMISQMSLKLYLRCIIMTLLGKGKGDRIRTQKSEYIHAVE